MDDVIEKVYFDIGEVASMAGIATSTIRFWGHHFVWLKPKFNRVGHRHYTKENIKKVLRVAYLIRECGVSITGIQKAYKKKYFNNLIEFFRNKTLNNEKN